jgi:hypothetical protein
LECVFRICFLRQDVPTHFEHQSAMTANERRERSIILALDESMH